MQLASKIICIVVSLIIIVNQLYSQTTNFKFNQTRLEPKPPQSLNKTEKDIFAFSNKSFKHFTIENGLPQNIITSLTVDSSGRLWVGTQYGAAFYNGRKWTIINMPNRVISNYIQAMYVSSDSAIWFGTSRGGVYRFHSNSWQYIDTVKFIKGNVIRGIQEVIYDSSKTLWFGTNTGILKYENGTWSAYYTNSFFYNLCKSKDNVLWCVTDSGIVSYAKGIWNRIKAPKELSGTSVFSVMQGNDGAMWFGGNGYIGKYSGGKWQLYDVRKGLDHNIIRIIYQSSSGDIWIGAESGIMRIIKDNDSNDFVEDFYSGSDFLKRMNIILSIIETPDKSMWFGTLLGLYRYLQGNWQTFREETGLGNNSVSYLYQSLKGDYFFGTYNGLYRFSNGKWTLFDKNDVHSHNNISSIAESGDGKLWVGTIGDGLNCYSLGKWQHFDNSNGLGDNRIYSLLSGNDGTLWIATARGIVRYLSGRLDTFATAIGSHQTNAVLPDKWVTALGQSTDSALWIGTRKGLVRYKRGEWKTFTIKDGLAGDAINYIYSAKDGKMWFGTLSSGVSCFNPVSGIWKTYNDTTTPALSSNVISQIKEDAKGRLYFLTNGVTRFTPLNVFNKNGNVEYKAEVYTTEDGLPSNEGIIRAAMVDMQGNIWVGTTNGVAFFNPLNEQVDKSIKPLIIEKIIISNYSLSDPPKPGLGLSYNQNDITFEYALFSYLKESETRYQVQLVGYDTKRSGFVSDYKKEYTNLPEGEYIFRVWGKDYAGNISGPAEFGFVIRPSWWNTWWSDGIKLLLIIGFVFLTVRIYLTFKLKKQKREYEKSQMIIKERDRIARDVHDAVGGSLTRISMLSERVNAEIQTSPSQLSSNNEILNKVNLIGTTARDVIEEMSEVIWSLDTKNDKLDNLINYMIQFINKMFETSQINLILKTPTHLQHLSLRSDYRWNIYLIFKEMINNIIKHSEAKNVHCTIDFAGSVLSFIIYDDGKGFIDTTKPGKGYGLQNIRRRAKALNATLNFFSEPDKGTKIEFYINLHENPPI